MFASFATALALVAFVSRVVASPISHVARGYAQDADILEDYTPYHVRYIALSCHQQHDSAFFTECCHPLLRSQKLSDRPAKCTPSATASSSAALAEPTSPTVDEDPIPDEDDCVDDEPEPADDDEDDCEDDDPTSAPATSAAPATSTAAPTPVTSAAPMTTSHTTTSAAPEPSTTSEAPATTQHTTTTTHATSSAAPTTSAASGSGGDDVFKGGFATFFTQDGNAGACGKTHSDSDLIVAADFRRYGSLDKQSPLCGKQVQITNVKNGKTVTATVADACPTCENKNSLDLSLGAFDKIGARETGMLDIEWHFTN